MNEPTTEELLFRIVDRLDAINDTLIKLDENLNKR